MTSRIPNTVEPNATSASQNYLQTMMERPVPSSSSSETIPPITSPRGTHHSSTHHHSKEGKDDDLWQEAPDARPILPKAAFFMGDLRDGLPMLNMQAAFLISAKQFTEKQVGVLFLCFSLAQFICLAPAGYYLDYSRRKIQWVLFAGVATAVITVFSVLTAAPNGENMGLMIFWKLIQGGVTAILPPGYNGITLGIVGGTGFAHQVSRNRFMNHMGTALVVAIGSLIAYFRYPNIGLLFIVSPLAAIGFYHFLRMIKPTHVNTDAARGLIVISPTMTEYEYLDDENEALAWECMGNETATTAVEGRGKKQNSDPGNSSYIPPDVPTGTSQQALTPQADNTNPASSSSSSSDEVHKPDQVGRNERADTSDSYGSLPSFNFGWGSRHSDHDEDDSAPRPQSPLAVLMNSTLWTFTIIVFFFHVANSSVLPLVMQSLSLQDPQMSILLSGLCIVIAQGPMAFCARLAGDYSSRWGRKGLILVGLLALTVRCFLLTGLVATDFELETEGEPEAVLDVVKLMILSTQLLDSIGAGIFGTLYILITNDISEGTGRFSLMLGVTTGAMCLGGTVSGYIGQALAQDYGYPLAFASLGFMSLIPFLMYVFFMPETLPDYAKQKPRRERLEAILQKINKHRRRLSARLQGRKPKETNEEGLESVQGGEETTNSRAVSGTTLTELV